MTGYPICERRGCGATATRYAEMGPVLICCCDGHDLPTAPEILARPGDEHWRIVASTQWFHRRDRGHS